MQNTQNITVNMENLSDAERNQLIALIEKANKPKEKVWKPKRGDIYCSINSYGGIENILCSNDIDNNGSYAIGNCFKSREEAEFTIEHLKVIAELKRFAQEYNEDGFDPYNRDPYNRSTTKYKISYNIDYDEIVVDFNQYYLTTDIYFSSKEIVKQAIQKIGEERLKKYYFCIPEETETK